MPPRAQNYDRRIAGQIKLRDLHILFNVLQFGSMAKAASHLAISQPTVSAAIASLEHAIGARLVDRSPHGVAPTIYGDALSKRGLEAFDALKQGMRDIEFLTRPGAGHVWMGCGEPYMGGLVPAIIRGIATHHPDVVVHAAEVNVGESDFKLLRERKLDLVLGRKLMPKVDDDLTLEVLFHEPIVVVVGACNRLASRRKITLSELSDERWIFAEPNNFVQSFVSKAFVSNGVGLPKVGVVATSMHLRFSLLATGQYVSAIPKSLAQYCASRWSLKILPVDLGVTLPCGIITLVNRTLSPVAQLFIEAARREAKSIVNDARHLRRVSESGP